ncbi:Integral membrane sensor signal transduction histidine kinase [Tepidanaerobacter acetatoxydans Re1]|uniref:Integral membrane sensor signal transduction histidine kinase n=1 Tax=Tepidanaerobacter acetatoxydans (strain DSM 21804 / JCM 16047 / Re1) TaxID=1209989 RepID=F4LXP4_TEPAE|nr:histidine kinase [Tepidanaerobacter acetatoxydans]AEE91973.1 integral membrane sensor signal transduction histidine kinase [Tepidanaerobacter acetatoxydans Re1]CCP26807.1 Integral membrane sensor signal transduction histidine kinase [Tepidanaerobacter acetatoxydans Re1]
MMKELLNFTGIRKKLIVYYLVVTLLMGMTSIYSYYTARSVTAKFNDIFVGYVYLNNLYADVSSLEINVEKYLSNKSSEALLDYYMLNNKLQTQADELIGNLSYDSNSLMIKDIGNMIKALLKETDAAINAKRGRMSSEYLARFTESHKIAGFIKLYINELLYNKLQEGSKEYYSIKGKMAVVSYVNLIIIISSIIFSIVLAMYFTYKITRPIVELSVSAGKISQGNFDVEPIKIETNDELSILAKAFNEMTVSIKCYIDTLKHQAEVEARLKEQEMQNLRMKSILKDAELKSLQSQINPHFLFNTLNAASQLAIMEGADRSSTFIEKVANLFRYNLRGLDKPVTLKEEIENAKTYMYILKTRFGDKVEFLVDVDEKALDIEMPCTIIQPLLENAFIHGIENLERIGTIELKVMMNTEFIAVEVRDDGLGMDEQTIKTILSVSEHNSTFDDRLGGIGLQNVIRRMMLFYNKYNAEDVIEVISKKDYGTKVMLKVPIAKGVYT